LATTSVKSKGRPSISSSVILVVNVVPCSKNNY